MCEVKAQRRGFTLGMLDTHKRKRAYRGKTLYEIMARVERDGCRVVRFPDAVSLQILAHQYLGSEYEEQWRGLQSLSFLIKAGVPVKSRDLFLHKVARATRLSPPRRKRAA